MNAPCVGFSFGAAILMWLAAMVTAQGSIDLKQGWNAAEKERFWFTPQGSLLLPYDWFKYLEQPSSNELFRSDANISKFGYIPAKPSNLNRDGFPIGFAKDSDRSGQSSFVGMTCAACHTAKINIAATDVIVEGAPALADFRAFVTGLVDALDGTSSSATKFTAFAEKVLGHTPTEDEEKKLRKELDERRKDLRRRWLYQGLPTEYGPARLDAFGGLYNQVVAYDLDREANAKPPDAPVSYPFLWDTPHHDKVQWNGSATNGLVGLGPIFRNIGEALGVFGTLEFENSGSDAPKYRSSVNVDHQKDLEKLLGKLRSPVWPEAALETKPALVRQGAIVYGMYCSGCHAILKDPGDPKRKVKAKMVEALSVGYGPEICRQFCRTLWRSHGFGDGNLEGSLQDVSRRLITAQRPGKRWGHLQQRDSRDLSRKESWCDQSDGEDWRGCRTWPSRRDTRTRQGDRKRDVAGGVQSPAFERHLGNRSLSAQRKRPDHCRVAQRALQSGEDVLDRQPQARPRHIGTSQQQHGLSVRHQQAREFQSGTSVWDDTRRRSQAGSHRIPEEVVVHRAVARARPSRATLEPGSSHKASAKSFTAAARLPEANSTSPRFT
jgi:hypothetical protein